MISLFGPCFLWKFIGTVRFEDVEEIRRNKRSFIGDLTNQNLGELNIKGTVFKKVMVSLIVPIYYGNKKKSFNHDTFWPYPVCINGFNLRVI